MGRPHVFLSPKEEGKTGRREYGFFFEVLLVRITTPGPGYYELGPETEPLEWIGPESGRGVGNVKNPHRSGGAYSVYVVFQRKR